MSCKAYLNAKTKYIIICSIVLILGLIFFSFLGGKKEFILSTTAHPTDTVSEVQLPIIMYHSVLKNKRALGKFVISPEEFESDLKYLKDNGFTTVFVQDLIDFVYDGKNLAEKPIMLTFDDGYYNNYFYAFPLLKQYESKIVLSPIGVEVDKYSQADEHNPNYSHATWEDLIEMVNSGLVEIQNHSYNMHKMSKKRTGTKKNKRESLEEYKQKFIEDVTLMQNEVQEHIKTTPTAFIFPFGAVSNCSVDILKELGFKATMGCENKINTISKDPECLYGLCRYLRPSGISSEYFFKKKMKIQ